VFWVISVYFNPLNPELNPIYYLLALLAHHFLHVSRIRVKLLTLRLLMSYIYDISNVRVNIRNTLPNSAIFLLGHLYTWSLNIKQGLFYVNED